MDKPEIPMIIRSSSAAPLRTFKGAGFDASAATHRHSGRSDLGATIHSCFPSSNFARNALAQINGRESVIGEAAEWKTRTLEKHEDAAPAKYPCFIRVGDASSHFSHRQTLSFDSPV
jgi:hypothetical protein